jgi:protein-tyrosine phosphatase
MVPEIYWIDRVPTGRLAIMARPRADDWLEDEIAGWREAGVDIVVSLLERHEVHELGLDREAELCRDNAIEFVTFPIPDRGVPESRRATIELAERLADHVRGGRSVAVHCRAGIGRSGLIAACILGVTGIGTDSAFKVIGNARGVAVPDTEQQRDWVHATLQSK